MNGRSRTGSALGFFALRVRFGFGFGLANADDEQQQRAMKNGKAHKSKRRSFRGLLTGEPKLYKIQARQKIYSSFDFLKLGIGVVLIILNSVALFLFVGDS